MRNLSILLPATLFVIASSSGAQSMPYPQEDTAPVTTVVVTAKPFRVNEDQARQIAGTYDLSNGWRLKVNPSSHTIATTIDRQKPMRLVAVAPYKFASGDGRVTMEFNRGDFGEDMIMTYAPDPRLADMVVVSSTVAQR